MDPTLSLFMPILFAAAGALLTYALLRPTLRNQADVVKAVEERASAANRIFRSGFDRSPLGIGFFTSDGSWLHTNPKLLQMLGYRREQLLRLTVRSLTHPEDRKRESRLLAEVRAGRASGYSITKRLRKGDGEFHSYRFSLARCSDASGEIVFACFLDDIPEQEGRQSDIFALFDRFSDVSVIQLDTEGMITSWNRGAEQILGYKDTEMIGKSWARIHSAKGKREGGAHHQLAVAAKEGVFHGTDSRVASDEAVVAVEVTIVPQFRGRELSGFLEISRESQSHSLREYRNAYERLKRVSDEKIQDLVSSNELLRDECRKREERESTAKGIIEQLRRNNSELTHKGKILGSAVRKLIEQRSDLEKSLKLERDGRKSAESEAARLPIPEDAEWREIEFSELCKRMRDIVAAQTEATLLVRHGESEKQFFFDDGRLVSCSSDSPELMLGQLLVESGRLTAAQREKAIDVQRQAGLSLGRILVLLEMISDETLDEIMQEKVAREMTELRGWAPIRFLELAGEATSLKIAYVPIDLVSILDRIEAEDPSASREEEPPANRDGGESIEQSQAAETPADPQRYVYRSSGKGRKFQAVDCVSVRRIPKKTRKYFGSREEAEDHGFKPCKRCVQ
jgi:PAS domain S-box-containing protein